MRKTILFVIASLLASVVYAACPPGTRYDCYTDYRTGKQVCGCRY